MVQRRTSGNTVAPLQIVTLRALLKTIKRREIQLRHQLVVLEQQRQQLCAKQYHCQSNRAEVGARLADLLSWQGVQTSRQALENKRQMSELFSEKQKIMATERQLQSDQQQLEQQRTAIQGGLAIVLKRKEKIDQVLTDESYQS